MKPAAPPAAGEVGARPRPPYVSTGLALAGFAVLSRFLPWAHRAFGGDVPPLFAEIQTSLGPAIVVPVTLAVGLWIAFPRLERLPRPTFLAALAVFGWISAVSLSAQAGGWAAVTAPFIRPLDYWATVPLVEKLGPRRFASEYPGLIASGRLSLHATTHPPGASLFLWVLSRVGGGSVLVASLVVAAVGALGVWPTNSLGRATAGDRAARAAALLFICSPGVLLYSATSMDAVFMTVMAVTMAALVRAPRSARWAVAAGTLAALALCFTFSATLLLAVGVGVWLLASGEIPGGALVRRALVGLTAFVGAVFVAHAALAIDLVAIFRASLHAHLDDLSHERSYGYWVIADVPAFLATAGIGQSALLLAATRARWLARRPGLEAVLWGTMALAALSGLFRGEVDHIWLFFIPLVAVTAGEAAAARPGHERGAAAGGAGQAVAEEVFLNTFW